MSAEEREPFLSDSALPPDANGAEAQALSDRDQSISDSDQTESDLDQTAAEADQSAAERDQRAAESDQLAADRDQAAGDKADLEGVDDEAYRRSRQDRANNATERDLAAEARSQTARIRDEAAARRDRMAAERDAAARARDELAAALDAEIERLEQGTRAGNGRPPAGLDMLLSAAGDRQRAAATRARAAAQRAEAARDRERAADDRRQAAFDRRTAAEELAKEGIDHLTGALRRGVGLGAIQREIDRTRRTGERLVVAFVDVDGLKKVNDGDGHAAGDELLRKVARSIAQHLRSYDVIARFGGDEFVCSLSGPDAAGAAERFDQIASRLAEVAGGATVTVGLAERGTDDTLDELVRQADAAMIHERRHRIA